MYCLRHISIIIHHVSQPYKPLQINSVQFKSMDWGVHGTCKVIIKEINGIMILKQIFLSFSTRLSIQKTQTQIYSFFTHHIIYNHTNRQSCYHSKHTHKHMAHTLFYCTSISKLSTIALSIIMSFIWMMISL